MGNIDDKVYYYGYPDASSIDFEEFKKNVIETYANNVPKDKIKKYVLSKGNYNWHLFSSVLLHKEGYLIGEEAKEAYDLCDKTNAIVFYELPKNHFFEINDDFMTSQQISSCGELYVFSRDLSWIFFGTHEESLGLGPYFIRKK